MIENLQTVHSGGVALLRQIYDKIYDNYHGFSNVASNMASCAGSQSEGRFENRC